MPIRPRLTPAIADVRRAVRAALAATAANTNADRVRLVLVALSGGADSLALAAATAFEAPRAGVRAGAVVVDHALQPGSAEIAARAARQAHDLGLDPVVVMPVAVASGPATGGPEAAARDARYRALEQAMAQAAAGNVLLGHTLDDQAETVLLGLARGSGPVSLQGMAAASGPYLRPLLGIRRETTRQFCVDAGLIPWSDPHNLDPAFARVRVRRDVLPVLERELGPGVAEALARTALQLREDAAALDSLAADLTRTAVTRDGGVVSLDIGASRHATAAVLHRVIRLIAAEFGTAASRTHTLAVAALIADWRGQKGVDLPGIRVVRQDGRLLFRGRAALRDAASLRSVAPQGPGEASLRSVAPQGPGDRDPSATDREQ